MNTNVNTNIDFGTNSSSTNTTSSIGSSPNNSSPTYQNTYTSNGNVQTESIDLSFAAEQVATESKSILDSIGDFFSDVGEGLKNTGAAIVDGAKTVANWAITGIKDLGSSISEACSNLASNVSSILGSALSWAKDTYISLQATSAVIGTTVVSGIADIGEGIVDGLTWCGGKLVEGGSWLVGKVAGWFSDDAEEAVMEWREQAKTDVKEFIATDWVGEANDWFYQDTALGRYINKNSYLKYDSEAMQKLRGATETVGKLVLATAASCLPGGAAVAVPLLLGFSYGTGEQAEKMYQENMDTTGAQELGIFVSGLGEAANWYAQGKMGKSGLDFFNIIKGNGLKNTGAAIWTGIKSTLGNIKSNGFKNTITGIFKNSNWASLYAADNLADSAGIVADNVSDWLVGNEEMNVQTFMSAGGELISAWFLNMFFDGAGEYLGNLGKGADDVSDAIKQVDNMELSQTELDGITAGQTYFQPAGDLPSSTMTASAINDSLPDNVKNYLDNFLKDPDVTPPMGIPQEIIDYINAYSKNPDATLPMGVPEQITQYLNIKSLEATAPLPIIDPSTGTASATPSTGNKIIHTNIDQAGPYQAQLAAFEEGTYAKFGNTDLPEEAVMSEMWQLYMYDEDELTALAEIEKVFGPNSIQAETARGMLVQEMMGHHDCLSAQPYEVARRVDEVYSAIGHQSRDLTADMVASGAHGSSHAESICQQYFSTDYSYWQQASASGNAQGMKAYTGSGYHQMNGSMRQGIDNGSGALISQLSDQISSLPGMQERTILYRGLDDLNWVGDGALRGKSGQELVDAINSLGGGTYTIGDNAFASSTPIMGQGFTGKQIVEVTSCPPGTMGSYLGNTSSIPSEVEYLLQAGESNRKVILGAEMIGSQVFVYTEIVPTS